MNVVFISNKMSPHMLPLCDELNEICKYEFCFIETMEETDTMPIGWKSNEERDYIVPLKMYQREPYLYQQRILQADVVVIGSAPERMIEQRLKNGGFTFRYVERFYKKGTPLKRWLRDCAAAWLHHGRFQKYPIHMLCASAYAAADAARFGNYKDRCYRWGYFPETKEYEHPLWDTQKNNAVPVLLWVGRMIDWKHPDDAVLVAEKLKNSGCKFRLKFIGSGDMEEQLQQMVAEKGLSDCVEFLGLMTPEEVREHMEQANIHLVTSDIGEGWGAVVNESMNSACAVVASHALGSVPFLLKDRENGCIYRSGDVEMLIEKVKALLDDPAEQRKLGEAAYETILQTWNAKEAARRLVVLTECIRNGEETPFTDDPCSRAPVLREDWYTG